MDYFEFIDRTDLLISGLSTAALDGDDKTFDKLSMLLDEHYEKNADHHTEMLQKRRLFMS